MRWPWQREPESEWAPVADEMWTQIMLAFPSNRPGSINRIEWLDDELMPRIVPQFWWGPVDWIEP